MSSMVLDVKDLCKTYVIDEYSNNVLQNVSFSMEEGEFVSIMGPSGSGKSTLLYDFWKGYLRWRGYLISR